MFSTAMNTRDTSSSKAKATSMAVSIHDFKTLLALILLVRPANKTRRGLCEDSSYSCPYSWKGNKHFRW